MKNPTLGCILRFKHGATCGKPSANSTNCNATKKPNDPCNETRRKHAPRGCLPWETKENKEFCERNTFEVKDHAELDVLKKEYPMLHAVNKKYIPGCPVPGWHEINLRSKQKAEEH